VQFYLVLYHMVHGVGWLCSDAVSDEVADLADKCALQLLAWDDALLDP
jgi:hypothetical protein